MFAKGLFLENNLRGVLQELSDIEYLFTPTPPLPEKFFTATFLLESFWPPNFCYLIFAVQFLFANCFLNSCYICRLFIIIYNL